MTGSGTVVPLERGSHEQGGPATGVGAIAELAGTMGRVVASMLGPDATFAEREVAYLDVANQLCQLNIHRELDAIVKSHGKRVLVHGVEYKEHETGTVDYHSLCGPIPVERPTFRLVGMHNGPTIVPLDLAAGLMHRTTPALAFALVSGSADGTDRQCEEQLSAAHRLPPSRSTIARVAKALGTKAKSEAVRIEAVVRQDEQLPEGAHAVSVGLDRTSVPMEEPRPEGAPVPVGRRKRTKPYQRAVPDRIDVKYRMAYVGTVSIVDEDGQSLVVRRYAASKETGPEDILGRMMADIQRIGEQKTDIPVGIAQDGAPEMWNLVRTALESIDVEPSHEAVDRYHFDERMGDVLRIVEPDADLRAEARKKWGGLFDTDDTAIDTFASWLAQKTDESEDEEKCTDKELEVLEDNRTFISNNKDRLRYASILQAGLPQGSGATEGSCKSLVSMRAKRSAQRWHSEGLDAILTFRGIKMSGRLPPFWSRFALEYTAEVRLAA